MPLPSFDELPVRAGAPPGSSWGLWGDDDVFGCLNLLTPERVQAAMTSAVDGRVFNLNLELELPDPPLFGRSSVHHVVHDTGTGHDDEIDAFNTQSSSQWDGFRHVRHFAHGYYNDVADADHGVHHWARRGIVGRAVLVDVGLYREHDGRPLVADAPDPIEPDDILATLDEQRVRVEVGDILLIRTGWLAWYRALSYEQRAEYATHRVPPSCGLRPGTETARMLWNLHIAAAATDNPGFEVMPPGALHSPMALSVLREQPEHTEEWFLHSSIIAKLGLVVGELFDLDALAAACHGDHRYTCLFTSAPLNLHQGVASPPNALAIR
jgi:hypothetical protein